MSESRPTSSDAPTLPVVSLAPAFQSKPDYPAIARQMGPALELSGFFHLADHGIAPARLEALLGPMRRFFEADPAIRQAVALDRHNRGWLAPGQSQMKGARHTDLKEVFFFGRELAEDDPDLLAGVPLCARNRWPGGRADLRLAALDWLDGVSTAAHHVLAAMAVHLGKPPRFFAPYYERPMVRGQLIHYPAVPDHTPAERFGVAEHSDFGCITLLHQETAGLEVLTRQDTWLRVPPVAGQLVVNVGDLLERWTGGALPSTRHRVRNRSGASRYSIAVFFDPSPTAVIDPVDLGAAPGRFAPVGAADYIMAQNRAVFSPYKTAGAQRGAA